MSFSFNQLQAIQSINTISTINHLLNNLITHITLQIGEGEKEECGIFLSSLHPKVKLEFTLIILMIMLTIYIVLKHTNFDNLREQRT